jgi:hypothetical protein
MPKIPSNLIGKMGLKVNYKDIVSLFLLFEIILLIVVQQRIRSRSSSCEATSKLTQSLPDRRKHHYIRVFGWYGYR